MNNLNMTPKITFDHENFKSLLSGKYSTSRNGNVLLCLT